MSILKRISKNKNINAKQINLKHCSSVLVISPFNVEGFMLSIPAIGALREGLPPEGKIFVLVSEEEKKIAENCDYIDDILVLRSFNIFAVLKTIFILISQKYDILINFNSNIFIASLVAFLVVAKVKISYAQDEKYKFYNSLYNLKLYTVTATQHKILRYLNLVRFIGGNTYDFTLRVRIPKEDKEETLKFLQKHNISSDDILIGIHPTLKDENKRWSLNKFSQLVKGLIERYNAKIFVFYHKDEKDRLNEFMHIIKNQAIVVDTHDYLKMASLSRFLSCFICNETDFMHVFSPFTNLIVIWGNSEIEANKPSGYNHSIIKAADGHADSVPVSKVLEEVKKYL